MGIEFKLSDRELPASPAFIRFLDRMLSGRDSLREAWPDQISEQLTQGTGDEKALAAEAAERVMQDPLGRSCVARAYTLLVALLTGDTESVAAIQSKFRFINVVGIPRTGGSYLTAELYRSLAIDPHAVPGALAHDGFPEAGPFELTRGVNSWIVTLKTTAEYLTMVELFFGDRRRHSGKVIVPKKLPQSVYAPGLYQCVLGPDSDYVFTVRHPVAACVSTYEKSGGLPADGRLRVRSNIEGWIRRDLEQDGRSADQIGAMDYFDAYLRYWERYHLLVVAAGLSRCRRLRVIPYCSSSLESVAQQYHDIHGSGSRSSVFHVSDGAKLRHPDWLERAQPALQRVHQAWHAAGLAFPLDQIGECL